MRTPLIITRLLRRGEKPKTPPIEAADPAAVLVNINYGMSNELAHNVVVAAAEGILSRHAENVVELVYVQGSAAVERQVIHNCDEIRSMLHHKNLVNCS